MLKHCFGGGAAPGASFFSEGVLHVDSHRTILQHTDAVMYVQEQAAAAVSFRCTRLTVQELQSTSLIETRGRVIFHALLKQKFDFYLGTLDEKFGITLMSVC